MKPTDILRAEHRVIEQVLAVLEKMATQAEASKSVDVESARQVIDFIRHFADRCHHAKEEDRLFPALEARGFPRHGGPTGVMLAEHEMGRECVRDMDRALGELDHAPEAALSTFVTAARRYVALLREHIGKEDNVLFVLAERTIEEDAQAQLLSEFEAVEKEHVGEHVHEKYVQLAESLMERYGIDKQSIPRSGDFFCCH